MKTLLVVILAILTACQAPKTRIRSDDSLAAVALENASAYAQRVMAKDPVVLDARSALDYGVSHVPGSVNILWSDFSLPGGRFRDLGVLDPDYEALAKRLALWGVHPDRAVVVVGASQNLGIEAARVAWMLNFLGIDKVYIGSEIVFRGTIPRGVVRPENAKAWIPSVRKELQMPLGDFLHRLGLQSRGHLLQKSAATQTAAQKVATEQKIAAVLDVRESSRFNSTGRGWAQVPTSVPVINIPWQEFLTAEGRERPDLVTFARQKNIPDQGLVVVVGEDGVQGCGVAFILSGVRDHISCFSAGWPAIERSISTR